MRKLNYILGLRGIAAIMVYLFHFGLSYYPGLTIGWNSLAHSSWEKYIYATPLSFVYSGGFAVYVFLVLSGFFAMYQIDHARLTIQSFLRFAAGRWVRIAGPAFVSVLIAWWLVTLGSTAHLSASEITGSNWLRRFPLEPDAWLAISEALQTTIQKTAVTYNRNLYPLSYFFLGSIFIYTFARFVTWPIWRFVFLSLGFLLIFGTGFAPVLLGALLGMLYPWLKNLRGHETSKNFLGLVLILSAIGLGSIPTVRGDMNHNYLIWTIINQSWKEIIHSCYMIGAGMLLLGILLNAKSQVLLGHPVLQRIGSASYSIFVIQFVIIIVCSPLVFLVIYPHMPYDLAAGITFIVTSLLLIIISRVFYRKIERPFHALSLRIREDVKK